MLRWLIVLSALLVSSLPSWSWPVHGAVPPTITCEFTTGVATGTAGPCVSPLPTCNGVADDTAAWTSFTTWVVAWQATHTGLVQLNIAGGKNCTLLGRYVDGIKKLRVVGAGAGSTTISDGGLGGFNLGAVASVKTTNSPVTSATVATVSAGATIVTLLNASLNTLWSIGDWALISGLTLQADWQSPGGFPPNPFYFEYAQITSINAGTGEITFSAPLVNTYKSTWPSYNTGSAGQVNPGGPATLYQIYPAWDLEVEYRNLTITNNASQTSCNARSCTLRDVTVSDMSGNCLIPSQNKLWQAINANMANCSIENDKLVSEAIFTNVTLNSLFSQSSNNLMTVRGSTIASFQPGRRAVISNSTITELKLGPSSFGRNDEVSCTTCVIAAVNSTSTILEKGPSDAGVNVGYTMSGGIITIPNTLGAPRWAVPGSNITWSGQYASETLFQITDVTQDETNTYVHTSLAGGFPTLPLTSGKLYLQVHPAPKWTCTCTGSTQVVDLAQTPAGNPIFSYTRQSFTGVAVAYIPQIWGSVTSIKVNFATAYTGAASPLTMSFAAGSTTSAGAPVTYNPVVNARIAGERVVTSAGVTGTQSGDSALTLPTPTTWMSDAGGTFTGSKLLSTDISGQAPSGWPAFSIEIITDQGVVLPYLLKRDLHHDNDNTPMWLNMVG